MANFTAGTSFSDGVTNDVTALKLNALVADAVPTSNLSLNSTTGTIATFNSTTGTIATLNSTTGTIATLNSTTGTIANFTASTANITLGTIPTLTAGTTTGTAGVFTSGTITTGVIPTLTAGTTTSTAGVFTTGTIATLNSTTPTFLGAITASTNTINVGSGQIYKDASGNVGVGTASPTAKLNVNGTLTVSGTLTSSASIILAGSESSPLGISTGDSTTGLIELYGGATNRGGTIQFRGGGNSGDLRFLTGTTGTGTERLRINSSGNVGIGMTPTAQLELSTDSAKKPSTNTWTIASDQRLKTNITNADNDRCYEIVKQVPLKRYTWRSEVYSEGQVKDRSKLGWIAQDVEAVFPKAVGTNRFAYNQVFEDVVTPELDSDGNAVLDENGVAKTKTEKRLVSEEVIEDCKDLNSDQIYAAMYGTIQKLIEKVEFLESKVAILEAA